MTMGNFIDYTGQKLGKLTVISRHADSESHKTRMAMRL
jgi:hypothetical protein